MIWANFLHFYQPPTQKRYWVDRITDECYQRILRELEKAPGARLTLNITGALVELWDKWGHQNVIEGYRKLLENGQIELTGSAKYHPLLPKIPKEEIVRQIKLNEETLEKYFGIGSPPQIKGFFPPEMAYDQKTAATVAELGYEWIIAEELSLSTEFNKVDYTKIYKVKGSAINGNPSKLLTIYFRQRGASYKILSGQLGTANLFLTEFENRMAKDNYLLTAMDGETFGHHRPGLEQLLFELYNTPNLKTSTISELSQHFDDQEIVATLPSTWALMEKDIEKNIPFARWEDPGNEIHKLQWELTNLAIKTVQMNTPTVILRPEAEESSSSNDVGHRKKKKQWLKARKMLDRSLHSDQYWWASARPWWSLDMIERGAKELMDTVSAVPDVPEQITNNARELYYKIITTGFEWQRTGKVEELSQKEDEEIRMRTDASLPKLPKEELEKMIGNVRREMEECAKKEEYERAAQLRDRVRELSAYA